MDDTASSHLSASVSSLLDHVALPDYYGPPNAVDHALAGELDALGGGAPGDWKALVDSLTEQHQRVLARYALRAPMLALRTGTRRHLSAGLMAHSLIHRRVRDWRDDLVFFAPYVYVAHSLGADVPVLFDDATHYAVTDLATLMHRFARRNDVTLEAFGWRQVDTPDGPTFETTNWNGAPSGAVVGERSWDEVNQAQLRELLAWRDEQTETRDHGRGE